MISLAPYEDMLTTYANAVENSEEHFRRRFHGLIEQTRKFQAQWEQGVPEGDDAILIEVRAAQNMARDLGYYREQARNVADGVKDGRFPMADAIARTNCVLGDLTGLRKFFETLAQSSLTLVEHARLDTRVEVLQEEIATKLVRAVDIMFGKTVVFDASKGGLAYKDWTLSD